MLDITSGAVKTIDHDEIRDWIEEHNGCPAKLSGRSLDKDTLRVEFEGEEIGEDVEEIPWEDFFGIFENEGLVFAYEQRLPQEEDKRPDQQKFEILDTGREGMPTETDSEMDDRNVQSNMKETAGREDSWRDNQTAEGEGTLRE